MDNSKFLLDFQKFEQDLHKGQSLFRHDSISPLIIKWDSREKGISEITYLDHPELIRCLFRKGNTLCIFECPKNKFYRETGYIDSDSYEEIKNKIIIPRLKLYRGDIKEDLKESLITRRTLYKSNNQSIREKAKYLLEQELKWIDEWK